MASEDGKTGIGDEKLARGGGGLQCAVAARDEPAAVRQEKVMVSITSILKEGGGRERKQWGRKEAEGGREEGGG